MLMQINTVQWVSLPIKVRLKLVEIFDLPRSGNTEVEDGQVITDGYTHSDLAEITVERMQEVLMDTVEDDYFKLFRRVLDSINEQFRIEEEAKLPKVEEPIIDTASEKLEVSDPVIINTNEEKTNEQPKESEQKQGGNTKRVRTNNRNKTKES